MAADQELAARLAKTFDTSIGTERGRLITDALSIWARLVEQMLTSSLRLWKIPLELTEVEDVSMGVYRTSFNFPVSKAPAPNRSLRCTRACEIQSGEDLASRVVLKVREPDANASVQSVEITLPRTAPAGLYDLVIDDPVSGETQRYLHPFGVPGGRP